jgi:hypothetical protein
MGYELGIYPKHVFLGEGKSPTPKEKGFFSEYKF